jgi:hypothetical protein
MSVRHPSLYFFQHSNVLRKDIRLPSAPGLHCNSSKASFPRLSCPCRIPNFTAVIHSFNLPPNFPRTLLSYTQVLQLVSPAVHELVASSYAPAMAPPQHGLSYARFSDHQLALQPSFLASIFSTLRFLPSGHSVPLQPRAQKSPTDASQSSPYEIFYHLYKPNTPYRKTAPPPPDFSIVVVK